MSHGQQANKPVNFLAVSGSLRAASSNTALLRAAVRLAPGNIKITLYTSIANLPHFNPDLDKDDAPPAVEEFRTRLRESDGVLICSPEYAHGVPGVLKNALDWIVGSGEFMNKPVALINASSVATHAQASLKESLTVMMAKVSNASVPLAGNKIDENAIVSNPATAEALRRIISELTNAISLDQF